MIVFNECKIDKLSKKLIIDVKIEDSELYKDMYIKYIKVDTDKTFIECGPSDNSIEVFRYGRLSLDDFLKPLSTEEDNKPRETRVEVIAKELNLDNLSNNIFFVWVEIGGVPDPETPCGKDNKYHMAVAVDMRSIYNMAMSYIKELEGTCIIPKGFIDIILRLKAFELSLRTGNFLTAVKQWNKLFNKKKFVLPSKGCGCNGY